MTPAPKTVSFHTFGCKVNQYETEELREQLALGGFRVVALQEAADVVVINSCSVTADADSSCRQLVRKLLRERPASRLVVTGCYAEWAPDEIRALSPRVEVFGNREKPVLALALGVPTACVEEAARQTFGEARQEAARSRVAPPPVQAQSASHPNPQRGWTGGGVLALSERVRAYIKVQDGCDAHCTYCIIPRVRPELVCRPPDLILQEARLLFERGYREIVLTGVRLGRYRWQPESAPSPARGEETEWDLVRLVGALVELPGEFRVRLSSIEVTEIPDDLITLARDNTKLCPHFHIPLQSGDDEILKRMGRWYSADDYRDRVRIIKAAIPEVALSADVIVGFPGEGEKQFQNSARLLDEEGFSRLHVFRYSVRPGTPAERLKGHVDPCIKSARLRRLVELGQDLQSRYAQRYLHRSVRVLVESEGSGYSDHYVRVQSPARLSEGTFQRLIPSGVTAEGTLIAERNEGRVEA